MEKYAPLNPYFRLLKRQKRLYPECGRGMLDILPSLSPNGAYEECPKCWYIQSLTAPRQFWVDEDVVPKSEGKIIAFKKKW